jgi:uncharacterized protein YaeQ
MALKSTIFKAELQVNDLDRQYYGAHALTLARHPSETDERMLVRLLAFALNADPALAFGKGLSTDDEPDLWARDLTGLITLWIDVGLPEAKLLKKAAGRADRVVVYAYGRNADRWWSDCESELARFNNLDVWKLAEDSTRALATLAQRNMRLNCTIQDEAVAFADGETLVDVERIRLKTSSSRRHGLASQ